MANNYPTWILQHKVKGTEIRTLKGRYYLYQVTSYLDKESKRSQKVTEAFLGRITELGLIKNPSGGYEPNVNLMYLFSTDAQLPVFYRLVPGNIRKVSAMALTIKES